MITELAYIEVNVKDADAFEQAVVLAKPQFALAKGCLGMRLAKVIETPGKYILEVDWVSVDAHMVDFRESDGFQEWRKLVGEFFVVPPAVEHVEVVSLF